MAEPSSRQELKEYCLRRLGHPVLEINVDDDQLDDLIDDAFQYYRERHMDGVEKMYLKHEITADDVTRFDGADETSSTPAPDAATWISRKNFIEVPEHVVGISKVMGISSNFARKPFFFFLLGTTHGKTWQMPMPITTPKMRLVMTHVIVPEDAPAA